jgi:hypothetical protein
MGSGLRLIMTIPQPKPSWTSRYYLGCWRSEFLVIADKLMREGGACIWVNAFYPKEEDRKNAYGYLGLIGK